MGRTGPLTSKRCILYIYSTNIGTEYFKHALYSPFFSLQNAFFFHNANLFGSCIIHMLHTECAKIKKNNSGAKGLRRIGGRHSMTPLILNLGALPPNHRVVWLGATQRRCGRFGEEKNFFILLGFKPRTVQPVT